MSSQGPAVATDHPAARVGAVDDPPASGLTPRVFPWLLVGSAAAAYGVFLLSMLSLLVKDSLGLDEATLGIAFAALGVGGITSPFVAGVIADRWGPRPVAITGLGCASLGSLLSAASPSASVLVAGEFLIGAGFSVFGVVAYAWINESLGRRRGLYLGVYIVSVVSGLSAAGLSIAFLLPMVASWRIYFVAASLLALVPAGALWYLLPQTLGVSLMPKDLRATLAHRDIRWLGGTQFLVGIGGGGFSWLPLFLVEARAFDLRTAVMAYVLGAVLWAVGGVAFGRLADLGWARPTIVLGGLGTGLAYLAFVLWDVGPGIVALLFLYAFLWPTGGQVPLTFLGQRLGPRAQRTEVGLLENFYLAGDAVGVALVGFTAVAWTLPWALAVIPGVATVAAAVIFGWAFGLSHGGEAITAEERAYPGQ